VPSSLRDSVGRIARPETSVAAGILL